MRIVPNTPQERKETGVICSVLPFDSTKYTIPVRCMAVEISGDAILDPRWTRIFANALLVAADIAEGKHVKDPIYNESPETT